MRPQPYRSASLVATSRITVALSRRAVPGSTRPGFSFREAERSSSCEGTFGDAAMYGRSSP
ncbi:hypothetical protein [Streptomyces sp. NPDC088180]|uniref:hypothetical protein n=1 Tax=Streptomyces sp. NPDC088180 TaxID=3365837 RepID=UPI003828FE6B